MDIDKTVLKAALATVLGIAAIGAQAAVFNTNDVLTINPGVVSYDSNGNPTNATVSWFGIDTNGNIKVTGTEKVALSMGTNGIVIGAVTTAGASHAGAPVPGDTNAITAPWNWFGNTGSDYNTVAITGSTTSGLNFSGWTMTWAGIPAINMGGGAWGAGFSNGVANIVWSGVYGTAYTLEYAATIPIGDASGFGGCVYMLHLEGIANAATTVPVPAAAWLFGSGLLALVAGARRNRVRLE